MTKTNRGRAINAIARWKKYLDVKNEPLSMGVENRLLNQIEYVIYKAEKRGARNERERWLMLIDGESSEIPECEQLRVYGEQIDDMEADIDALEAEIKELKAKPKPQFDAEKIKGDFMRMDSAVCHILEFVRKPYVGTAELHFKNYESGGRKILTALGIE